MGSENMSSDAFWILYDKYQDKIAEKLLLMDEVTELKQEVKFLKFINSRLKLRIEELEMDRDKGDA
jgi:hypothetical protein